MMLALLAAASLDPDGDCVKRWRTVSYITQAADIATTVAAIETGKGAEGNPVYKLVFGKNVTSWEVLALKGASIGLTELVLPKQDCRSYKISAGIVGGVAMLNLRVLF